MITFILIFFFLCIQSVVLLCCIYVGNDPYERKISDEEQIRYLSEWQQKHVQRN